MNIWYLCTVLQHLGISCRCYQMKARTQPLATHRRTDNSTLQHTIAASLDGLQRSCMTVSSTRTVHSHDCLQVDDACTITNHCSCPALQCEHLVSHLLLQWSPDDRELASGGNDNTVLLWHAGVSAPQHTLTAHKACVKALAWSPHQAGLLATGGGTCDQTIA